MPAGSSITLPATRCPRTISGDAAEAIGLIQRIQAIREGQERSQWMQKYPEVFEGNGEIKGIEVKLRLKEDHQEHVSARVAEYRSRMRNPSNKNWNAWCAKGVIRRIDCTTRSVSNIAVVLKANGKIRLCLDPQHLNKASMRGPHPTKRFEQIQPG